MIASLVPGACPNTGGEAFRPVFGPREAQGAGPAEVPGKAPTGGPIWRFVRVAIALPRLGDRMKTGVTSRGQEVHTWAFLAMQGAEYGRYER